MTKLLTLSVLLLAINAGSASAYFRCNSSKCQQARLEDKQERLQSKLATAKTSNEKSELQEEIESIQFEAKKLEEKNHSTASSK